MIIRYKDAGQWTTLLDVTNLMARVERLEPLVDTNTNNMISMAADISMLQSTVASHTSSISSMNSSISSMNTTIGRIGGWSQLGNTSGTSFTAILTISAEALSSEYSHVVLVSSVSGTFRPLATTFCPSEWFPNLSSGYPLTAVYGGEPSNYHAEAYYSSGTIYAKSVSQYDSCWVYGIV